MPEHDNTGRIVPDSIDWESGACHATVDPDRDIWFGADPVEALETCAICPIIDDCRTYAIDHQENYGVWGGMSEAELRRAVRSASDKPQVCEECNGLFVNRFTSAFCGKACRHEAAKRTKRVAKHRPALPQAHYIDRRTA